MAKGFFTQAFTVLFENPPTLAELAVLIDRPSKERAGAGSHWIAAPALQIDKPGGGCVLVDVIAEPWPDSMGNPQDQVDLFMAWSMGHLAPQCFPGNLLRAGEQCWHWPDGRTALERHQTFVRLRLSYVIDRGEEAVVIPPGVEPVEEMRFLSELAARIAQAPGALAVFVPAGESAHAPEAWVERVHGERVPIELWTNVRLFNTGTDWTVMDSVGLQQLDLPDFEACFQKGSFEPGAVGGFLHALADYQATTETPIEAGHTVDGPGGSWRAQAQEEALVEPPRRTLRLFPVDQDPPDSL